jgi:phage shock protein E
MVILDVRSPGEFATSHVEGAVNHDVQLLAQGKFPGIDKTEEVVTYCKSGNRSGTAQTILKQHGYQNVTNGGGLADMQRQGYNLV